MYNHNSKYMHVGVCISVYYSASCTLGDLTNALGDM